MKVLRVKRLYPTALLPVRNGDSNGYDVFAYSDHILSVGETRIIPCGFAAELEPGYVAVIWDRSGFGAKGVHTFHELVNISDDLRVVPFSGVIDQNYRGQWGVVLHNFSRNPFNIKHGDRVAQILFLKSELPVVVEAQELSETDRGGKGFGTTAEKAQEMISTSTLTAKGDVKKG
jgi:dUTP pyrophosphatase